MPERRAVVLTGATGFLGSRITRRLLEENYEVVALLRPDSDLRRLAGLSDQISTWVEEPANWHNVLSGHQSFGAVIHTATLYRDPSPVELLKANVHSPLRLLEAAQYRGITFLNTGTFFCKHAPAGRYAPYTLSKADFDSWAR